MGYPPYIENVLPAQQGDTLKIPYEPNRAITHEKLQCVVKTISTNDDRKFSTNNIQDNNGNNIAQFDISSQREFFNTNQYYKIQLANGVVSDELSNITYSNVGVFKYFTSGPTINLLSSYADKIQIQYTHSEGEQLYSYKINLYDTNNNLYETSGDVICNTSINNTSNYNVVYEPNIILSNNDGDKLICEFIYQTVNGFYDCITYTVNTFHIGTFTQPKQAQIKSFVNEGYNQIEWSGLTEKHKWCVRREVNSDKWFKIHATQLLYDETATFSGTIKDFAIDSGVEYQYGFLLTQTIYPIQQTQINKYEDIFLSDGEKQLKIQFNPKISSFKNTILESKIDTIGGKYPIFFRNAQTKYKEFPISGLISYLTDPQGLFFPLKNKVMPKRTKTLHVLEDEQEIVETFSTDLIAENIFKERQFRLAVLEWLSNGQPKLFRSATEGMYIVRLMNVSLTPNDTLGRMLYTFSATAYEIADLSHQNLIKYQLLNNNNIQQDVEQPTVMSIRQTYESINLAMLNSGDIYNFPQPVNYGRFIDSFNSIFMLNFESGISTQINIGTTGYYELSNITAEDRLISITAVVIGHVNNYTPTFEFEYSNNNININEGTLMVDKHEIIYGAQIIDLSNKQLSYVKIQVIDKNKDCTYTIDGTQFDLTTIGSIIWTADVDNYLPFISIALGDGLSMEYHYKEEA